MAASLHPPERFRRVSSIRYAHLRGTNLRRRRAPQLYCIDTRSSIDATGKRWVPSLRLRVAAVPGAPRQEHGHLLGYCTLLRHFHPKVHSKAQASRMRLRAQSQHGFTPMTCRRKLQPSVECPCSVSFLSASRKFVIPPVTASSRRNARSSLPYIGTSSP